MPRRSDEDNKTRRSQLNASEKYDSSVEHVRLRVPAGMKERMQKHVDQLPQYEIKGKHSINAWLVDLITRELAND